MNDFKKPGIPDVDRFTHRLKELRDELAHKPPEHLAGLTGAEWRKAGVECGEFRLSLWEKPIRLTYPDWIAYKIDDGKPAASIELTLLLYYFNIADGTAVEGNWISFSELPHGKFYNQAFQGYTGREVSRLFKDDLQAFKTAAEKLGGMGQNLGDASYAFWALPRVPVLVVYWLGDEEFPSSAQILFEASACHYLTTDACAILGSTITRRLISANYGR